MLLMVPLFLPMTGTGLPSPRITRLSVNAQVLLRRSDRQGRRRVGPCSWFSSRREGLKKSPNYLVGIGVRELLDRVGIGGAEDVTSPRRDSKGRIIWDGEYEKFRRKTATAKHVLARLKNYQVLRQLRKRGDNLETTIRAVAGLYNLNLDNPHVVGV